MRILVAVISFLISIPFFAQESNYLKDRRDGKIYKTVSLGTQHWMAENLDVVAFLNGDLIAQATNFQEWEAAQINETPAWCYYAFNAENGKKYGKLYNWYAVIDPRGLAPEGWRIPSYSDWKTLENYAFYKGSTATSISQQLMSKTAWNDSVKGTDELKFNALPGGYHETYDSIGLGEIAYYWSDDFEKMVYLNSSLTDTFGIGSCQDGFDGNGFSVRCIKNNKKRCGKKSKIDLYNKYFEGMVYIDSANAFLNTYSLITANEKDSTYYQDHQLTRNNSKAFYLSDHEVTNGEYKEFVNWVRDSIARCIIVKSIADDDPLAEEKLKLAKFVDFPTENKDAEGNYFLLNWDFQPRLSIWEDPRYAPFLDILFYSTLKESYHGCRDLDNRQLNYRYSSPDNFTSINIYPDTLCWLRDNKDQLMTNIYFWHPVNNSFPVVGITYQQALAYCDWRTKMYYKEISKYAKSKRIADDYNFMFRLPTEEEWQNAARGIEIRNTEKVAYEQNGYMPDENGKYTSNYGTAILSSGLITKNLFDDGSLYTTRVYSYQPNSNGIYCLFGNVAEWVAETPKKEQFFHDYLSLRNLFANDYDPFKGKKVYITDPYTDSTYLVEQNSVEHQRLIELRLKYYEAWPSDSPEQVKAKFIQLYSIDEVHEPLVRELIRANDSIARNLGQNQTDKNKAEINRFNESISNEFANYYPSDEDLQNEYFINQRSYIKLYDFRNGTFVNYLDKDKNGYSDFSRLFDSFEIYQQNLKAINRAINPGDFYYDTLDDYINCRKVKGGSWIDQPHYLLLENSEIYNEDEASSKIGFRVAMDADGFPLRQEDKDRLNRRKKMTRKIEENYGK